MAFIKNISSANPDETLVEQYKDTGDLKTLADLYQRYMEMVYGVCLKYLKEPEDAKDCVINIYEELIVKLQKHPVTHFKAWLYQLSKNHCLMRLRKRSIPTVNFDTDFVHSDDFMHLDIDKHSETDFDNLQDCLGKLVAAQRKAIEMFYMEERCYKDIAETTGLTTGQVRSYIQNGRRNLKICMDQHNHSEQ